MAKSLGKAGPHPRVGHGRPLAAGPRKAQRDASGAIFTAGSGQLGRVPVGGCSVLFRPCSSPPERDCSMAFRDIFCLERRERSWQHVLNLGLAESELVATPSTNMAAPDDVTSRAPSAGECAGAATSPTRDRAGAGGRGRSGCGAGGAGLRGSLGGRGAALGSSRREGRTGDGVPSGGRSRRAGVADRGERGSFPGPARAWRASWRRRRFPRLLSLPHPGQSRGTARALFEGDHLDPGLGL